MIRSSRFAAIAFAASALAACGHADPHDPLPVTVGIGISVPVGRPPPAPVAGLGLQLTRLGPEAVQLAWSFDPYAAFYEVSRNGHPLASARATSLIDASVLIGDRYCYQVVGLDGRGALVSTSSVGCLTLF